MKTIVALRLERQGFCPHVSEESFRELFRRMSPVAPPYWCCPGSPPELRCRTDFDSAASCFAARARREIVKGRFQAGNIAYILAEELPLFAALYQSGGGLSERERTLRAVLEREGPMSVRMLKEFTGEPVKELTADLHRLQKRFLVFEDQADSEWDRCWYRMEEVFPELDRAKPPFEAALEEVLLRFVQLNVTAGVEAAVSFYHLPVRKVEAAFQRLLIEGKLTLCREEFILPRDVPLLEKEMEPPRCVFALNRNDFLVKANEYWLREVYRYPGREVLQYLLIDGEFGGVTVGKFRNGPFEIEDILLNLPPEEWKGRREEILKAVGLENPASVPRRYCGKPL